MAEETANEQGTTPQTPPAEGSGERTFTQEEVNRMVADRLKRERSKYEGYVKADEADEAKSRAEKAEAELAELKGVAERAEAVAAAADKAGVPVEFVQMLNGTDAEELVEQIERVKKLLPAYPTRTDDGGARATVKRSTSDMFADSINKFFS